MLEEITIGRSFNGVEASKL